MSLNLTAVSLTPSEVNTGAQFIISVTVFDDVFEFDSSYVYDEHQGFGDIEQTIGGMFINDSINPGLIDKNGLRLIDSNGMTLVPSTGAEYQFSYTAEQVDNFVSEVLGDG